MCGQCVVGVCVCSFSPGSVASCLSVCHFFSCHDMVKNNIRQKGALIDVKSHSGALEPWSSCDLSTCQPASGTGGSSPRTQMFPQVPLRHLLPLSSPPSDLCEWRQSMRITDTCTFPLASMWQGGENCTKACCQRETPVTVAPQY